MESKNVKLKFERYRANWEVSNHFGTDSGYFDISRQTSPFGDPEAFWTIKYRVKSNKLFLDRPTWLDVEVASYQSGIDDWAYAEGKCAAFVDKLQANGML